MAQSSPRHVSQGAAQGRRSSGAGGSAGAEEGSFFLGRYRVVSEIGVGGMASVFLARVDGPGGFQKWVAIKRIHPHLVEDDQFVDMFLDEARIAAGISHANVAQVFELGKDEGTYWIAMEYLHGEPLRELIRGLEDKRMLMPVDLAAKVCADAADGLHAAHELRGKNGQLLGLVHRDVTPHNLFVTFQGYTKVVDFGIAKVNERLSVTKAGCLKGKLAYMSPEQIRNQEVDRTTDIFALGVVLWELTTGQRLFRMETDLDTLEKVQACVVPPPSTLVRGFPVELEAVIMKALAKRKQDRFQTAAEFSRALQNFLRLRPNFIGPEEVAHFMRSMFAERIRERERFLQDMGERTSNIDVAGLRAQGGFEAASPALGSGSFPVGRAGADAMTVDDLMDDDEDKPTQVAANQEQLDAADDIARRLGGQASHGHAPAGFGRGPDEPTAAISGMSGDHALAATVALSPSQLQSPAGYGPPPGMGYAPGAHQAGPRGPMPYGAQHPHGGTVPLHGQPSYPGADNRPQSQIETGLALQRPNPADLWMAQQEAAKRSPKQSAALVVVIALVTALCVVGVALFVYFKVTATSPEAGPVASAEATAQPGAEPSAAPEAPSTQPAAVAPAPSEPEPAKPEPTAEPSASAEASAAPKDPEPAKVPVASTPKAQPAAKEEPGFLTIVCMPSCDSVIDGGTSLGPAPIVRRAVKPGPHRITLKRAGSATKVISVTVVSGQVTAQRVNMK